MNRTTGQRSRQPQGTPIGGQYAPEHDGGPATSLEVEDRPVSQVQSNDTPLFDSPNLNSFAVSVEALGFEVQEGDDLSTVEVRIPHQWAGDWAYNHLSSGELDEELMQRHGAEIEDVAKELNLNVTERLGYFEVKPAAPVKAFPTDDGAGIRSDGEPAYTCGGCGCNYATALAARQDSHGCEGVLLAEYLPDGKPTVTELEVDICDRVVKSGGTYRWEKDNLIVESGWDDPNTINTKMEEWAGDKADVIWLDENDGWAILPKAPPARKPDTPEQAARKQEQIAAIQSTFKAFDHAHRPLKWVSGWTPGGRRTIMSETVNGRGATITTFRGYHRLVCQDATADGKYDSLAEAEEAARISLRRAELNATQHELEKATGGTVAYCDGRGGRIGDWAAHHRGGIVEPGYDCESRAWQAVAERAAVRIQES